MQYYDPVQHRTHALLYGQDPWVACRMWEGQVLWLLGYPDQALQRSQEAFAYAQELAHPFSMVFALYGLALVHQLRRESAACHEHAAMQLRLSEEQGFPFWAGPGAILLGWALAEQGHVEEGCQRLCDGLAVRQAMGAAQPRPYFSVLLAQVYGRAGKVQEALEVLSAALEGAADIGEQWCEAELYRLQGELLLQATGVERCAYRAPSDGGHSPPYRERGGGVFSEGPGTCPTPGCARMGATGNAELEPALGTARKTDGSPTNPGKDAQHTAARRDADRRPARNQ